MAASQQDILDYLQRYQDLVDDWDAFTAAMVQPQPTCIWRTEKFPRELFQQWLAQQDLLDAAKEQHWASNLKGDIWRMPANASFGGTWPFFAGMLAVMDESSHLPTALLDPKPGERRGCSQLSQRYQAQPRLGGGFHNVPQKL